MKALQTCWCTGQSLCTPALCTGMPQDQEMTINCTILKRTISFTTLDIKLKILDESGTAENKEELLFSHDKLSLASILRPLHQVTEEMLV